MYTIATLHTKYDIVLSIILSSLKWWLLLLLQMWCIHHHPIVTGRMDTYMCNVCCIFCVQVYATIAEIFNWIGCYNGSKLSVTGDNDDDEDGDNEEANDWRIRIIYFNWLSLLICINYGIPFFLTHLNFCLLAHWNSEPFLHIIKLLNTIYSIKWPNENDIFFLVLFVVQLQMKKCQS